MIPAVRSMRSRSAGFSLPEVTIALGLLGSVLVSMAGLFVMAERIVHGGRDHTTALSIARDILEETNGWHFEGTDSIVTRGCPPAHWRHEERGK